MRTQPPQIQKDITIQNADVGDYEEISYRLNSFYRDYNFFTPHTPKYLANWIDRTPFPEPINYYVTAKDKAGEMLAGLGITVEARLRYRKVSYMPLWMNLANKIFRIVFFCLQKLLLSYWLTTSSHVIIIPRRRNPPVEITDGLRLAPLALTHNRCIKLQTIPRPH